MINEDIAKAFYNDEIEKTENLFIEDYNGVKVIFSYGYHFPISVKFTDGYLFNKDGYSNTTARHKSLVLSYIKDDLTDEDFIRTTDLNRIIDDVKYNGVKSKAELIEKKI